MNNMTNVQAHRARLQEAGCRRLEVTIGGGMIDQLRDAGGTCQCGARWSWLLNSGLPARPELNNTRPRARDEYRSRVLAPVRAGVGARG